MKDADQWNLDGDCRICRRAKYCTKSCSKNRKLKENLANAIIMNAILKRVHEKEKINEDIS